MSGELFLCLLTNLIECSGSKALNGSLLKVNCIKSSKIYFPTLKFDISITYDLSDNLGRRLGDLGKK